MTSKPGRMDQKTQGSFHAINSVPNEGIASRKFGAFWVEWIFAYFDYLYPRYQKLIN